MQGSRELAWIYLAEASYWCGVTLAQKGIEQAYHQTVGDTKRLIASTGASKRAESYQVIKQFAYKMVLKKMPPKNGWQSRNHAVQAVKDATIRFAKRKRIRMSVDQAGKTIDSWLAKMPEAASLFPSKKKGSRTAQA